MPKADPQEYQHAYTKDQPVWYVTSYPITQELPAVIVEITEPDPKSQYGTDRTIITVRLEKDGEGYKAGGRHWGYLHQIRPREEG